MGKQRGQSPGQRLRNGGVAERGGEVLGGGWDSGNLQYLSTAASTITHTHTLRTPCLSLSIQAVNSPRCAAESTGSLVEVTVG